MWTQGELEIRITHVGHELSTVDRWVVCATIPAFPWTQNLDQVWLLLADVRRARAQSAVNTFCDVISCDSLGTKYGNKAYHQHYTTRGHFL